MTEIDLQKAFIERFNLLGEEYIKDNVYTPNSNFTIPQNKTWYELYFLSNPPVSAGLSADSQNRYTGIFQIDICTPLNVGTDGADDKYRAISKLFNRDTYFSNIYVLRCYRARQYAEKDHFRTTIRVEWTADIDKEGDAKGQTQ